MTQFRYISIIEYDPDDLEDVDTWREARMKKTDAEGSEVVFGGDHGINSRSWERVAVIDTDEYDEPAAMAKDSFLTWWENNVAEVPDDEVPPLAEEILSYTDEAERFTFR